MRYFLELSYNGTNYHGWQIQPNAISVQEVLQNSISTILKSEIKIVGAGRTDTGVHAKQMFAHFDFDDDLTFEFVRRLNQFLPKDISILDLKKVKLDAHARFDATERSYEYLISTKKNPFLVDWTWQWTNIQLDIDAMNKAGKLLLEYDDFTSFAKLHTDVKTNICDVRECFWTQENDILKLTITADRFLRNMVRAVVGTLVEVGKGKITIEEFQQIIEQKNRNKAGASAPAKGLYLTKVEYSDEIFKLVKSSEY